MVRRSSCMGGHLTDLVNMADHQEWKGQRFEKKNHVRYLKNCLNNTTESIL